MTLNLWSFLTGWAHKLWKKEAGTSFSVARFQTLILQSLFVGVVLILCHFEEEAIKIVWRHSDDILPVMYLYTCVSLLRLHLCPSACSWQEFDVLSQIRRLQASCSQYNLPHRHRISAWLQRCELLTDQERWARGWRATSLLHMTLLLPDFTHSNKSKNISKK